VVTKNEDTEPEPDEVIVDDATVPDSRTIRVYDPKGDFVIVVPAGAKVTFGYFNPAAPRDDVVPRGSGYASDNVARQTALRIYQGNKENQLACFIGVRGFRDESIQLTRFTRKVTVEQRLMRDGETEEWGGSTHRELMAAPEDDYL
jgi:hypothetical protein